METDVPGVLFNIDAKHCKTAQTKLCLAHRRYSIKCDGVCYSVLKERSCQWKGLGRWRDMEVCVVE